MRDLYQRTEAVFRGEDVARIDPLSEFPALVSRARDNGAAVDALPGGDLEGDLAVTRLAVAERDRPGLFADLVSALAVAGADIVGARVATAGDGMALDVFELQDGAGAPYGQAEPRRVAALTAALEAAARGDRPFSPVPPAPPNPRRAAFDVRPTALISLDETSDAAVVEVSGADRPGLLADLARVFADHGLSIRSAHIAGFGERAVDSFYVVDARGRKPGAGPALERLRAELEAALDHRPAGAGLGGAPVRASRRDVSEVGRRPPRGGPVSPDAEAR
jgi:[protein-PII] uridylyltransferase